MKLDDKINDRLEFLAKKFNVFNIDSDGNPSNASDFEAPDSKYLQIKNISNELLAILETRKVDTLSDKVVKTISISLSVFSNVIAADPTPNKSCTQWILNVFVRYIRGGEMDSAIRLIDEDLPQANKYIQLFEANKRKQKFKEFCNYSTILENIVDHTDINQYKSLSQLFDAVDPFIVREPSDVERLLLRFVELGQAKIPIRDRNFTLYIPLSTEASVVFGDFASWCTARPKNGMFTSYTSRLTPNNTESKLYIIINNKFFSNESNELYQLHFESGQVKDRSNMDANDIYKNVFSKSETLVNYFRDELLPLGKKFKGGILANNNYYVEYALRFGICNSILELIDTNSPIIRIMTRAVPKLPDLTPFKELDQLTIIGAGLKELPPSIGKLQKLEMLILSGNNLTTIPKEIGELKKLYFINLVGNKISDIPDEIKYLDSSRGGSLYRIAVKEEDIGEKNYKKLKKLLPNTFF